MINHYYNDYNLVKKFSYEYGSHEHGRIYWLKVELWCPLVKTWVTTSVFF